MKYIKSRILAWFVLLLGLIVVSNNTKAQNVQRKGNNFFVEQRDQSDNNVKKTVFTYTDSKNNVDTIYLSKNGNAFIWKTSKKTGNKYRKYLPEVTKQLGTKVQKKELLMHNTKTGNRVHNIQGHDYLTIGTRSGNTTIQKHYQIEYPKDLSLLWKIN